MRKDVLTTKPRVYLVDNDTKTHELLLCLLKSTELPLGIYLAATDFLAAYSSEWVGCILLEIDLPDMNGLEVQEELVRRNNNMPIIILTKCSEIPLAVRATKAGAFDFVTKPFDGPELLRKIQSAVTLSIQKQHERLLVTQQTNLFLTLTPREREVMRLITVGKLNKQIAHELNISVSTVELHRANLMKKLNVRTLADLIRIYTLVDHEA